MAVAAQSINYKNVKRIEGWLAATDFEIIKQLMVFQSEAGMQGAVVEIGVHHGKSFVALAAFSGQSKLYAIDVFGDQEKNIDQSGSGDRAIFIKNLQDAGIEIDRLVIDERMSEGVSADDIRGAVGPVKFFHIDGGHHFDAVISDIDLATKVMADDGIVVLDDVFRPEWPEVSLAAFRSQAFITNDFVLFAVGFNKSYFCKRMHVAMYHEALLRSAYLRVGLNRDYRAKADRVLVFQRYPLPEWGLRTFLYWAMSIYAPYQYVSFRNAVAKIKKMLGR